MSFTFEKTEIKISNHQTLNFIGKCSGHATRSICPSWSSPSTRLLTQSTAEAGKCLKVSRSRRLWITVQPNQWKNGGMGRKGPVKTFLWNTIYPRIRFIINEIQIEAPNISRVTYITKYSETSTMSPLLQYASKSLFFLPTTSEKRHQHKNSVLSSKRQDGMWSILKL